MNKGLPMGLPRLSGVINDVQRARYDLIAGKTSAGKTAFVDQCYVLNPFDHYMSIRNEEEIEVDWLYFSLEISPKAKFTKFAARELWRTYQVETSVPELWSLGQHELSPEKREMMDSLDGYFEELESRLHIYDEYETSTAIYNKIMDWAKENGKFTKKDGQTIYTPKKKNHYVIIIIDTINLLTPEKGQDLRTAINQVSKDMIWFRNVCEFSPVVVQQYNANISDPLRVQQKRLEPIADDLEDSKRTSKDCNTYLSVFDPSELNLQESSGRYDLTRLGDKFRQIQVLKNRDGERMGRVGCKFAGQIGLFEELPPSDQMTDEDYINALTL